MNAYPPLIELVTQYMIVQMLQTTLREPWMRYQWKSGLDQMDRLLNQFRRVYTDDGRHDVDFTERETLLQQAKARLLGATQELERASENLNRAAMAIGFAPEGSKH